MNKSLSIIIPCYNEGKNLSKLISKIKKNLNGSNDDIEVILVNNGSNDNSKNILEELLKNENKINFINLDKNLGYGNGILEGLKVSKNNFLAWTHADLQTDFQDCIKGFNYLYECYLNNTKLILKGKRINRNKFDSFFTFLMSKFIYLINKKKLNDINGQPKIFSRNLFKKFINPPKDFLLDYFLLNLAVEENYKILNIDVDFHERSYGLPKGGGSLIGKIKLSLKTIYYVIKYKYGNNNS